MTSAEGLWLGLEGTFTRGLNPRVSSNASTTPGGKRLALFPMLNLPLIEEPFEPGAGGLG